jgi:N-glycosidase YbiA
MALDPRLFDRSEAIGILSPLFPSKFTLDGKEWQTPEHYYQAQKTTDLALAEQIRTASTTDDAIVLGRKVPLRDNWDKMRPDVMLRALDAQFTQFQSLGGLLLSLTKNEKIHFPTKDAYWGIGADGTGKNMLGKVFMELRKRLQKRVVENAYLRNVVEQFASMIAPNAAIKKLANNTAVIGAYAEATVRKFVATTLSPLRVSSGAVVSPTLSTNPKKIPQIDTIVWQPLPLPAVFEAGDFALVDVNSCLGILEIKRSNYNANIGKNIAKVLNRVEELTRHIGSDPGFDERRGIGIVCLREHDIKDKALDRLIADGKAVVLVEIDDTEEELYVPNMDGFLRLIGFLASLRIRAAVAGGMGGFRY